MKKSAIFTLSIILICVVFVSCKSLSRVYDKNASTSVESSGKPDNAIPTSYVLDFPDKAFKEAVYSELNKALGESITKDEAVKVDELDLSSVIPRGNTIHSIRGIEYFSNLRKLNLGHNSIEDISPLVGNLNLEELNLSDNKIANIATLSKLNMLKSLYIGGNQISNIKALEGLDKLEYLYLADNKIDSIKPLAYLMNLKELYLADNTISDFEPLVSYYHSLDSRDFTIPPEDKTAIYIVDAVLEDMVRFKIDKYHRDLYEKDVASITSLEISHNKINSLSGVEHLKKLEELTIYDSISYRLDLTPLSKLPKLRRLFLQGNNFWPAPHESITKLKNITHLDLSENRIEDIAFLRSLPNLAALNLSGNDITDIEPLRHLNNLHTLYLKGNKISDYSPLKAYFQRLKHKDFKMKFRN